MRRRAEFQVTAKLHTDIREDSLVDEMCHASIHHRWSVSYVREKPAGKDAYPMAQKLLLFTSPFF